MGRFRNLATGVVVSVANERDSEFVTGWAIEGAPPAPDTSWKVADLRTYAEQHSIDLGDASKKDDILNIINR